MLFNNLFQGNEKFRKGGNDAGMRKKKSICTSVVTKWKKIK